MCLRTIMVGTPLACAILNSQTPSYRATLVEEFLVVVEQAKHPTCIWAKYFDMDVGVAGADALREPVPDIVGRNTLRQTKQIRARRDAHRELLAVDFEEDSEEVDEAADSNRPVEAGASAKAEHVRTLSMP